VIATLLDVAPAFCVARYFFHLRAPSGRLILDDEGVDLPDLDAAAREAASVALTFAMDAELGGRDYSGWHFEIRSASGSLNVPAFATLAV
jgi:hypothetical protein